jgi:putative SOS response-associated peptidase YedK
VQKSPIAFLWRKFVTGSPEPLYACVMVTVPANALIAALPTDRMPAILAPEDWAIWLGEELAVHDRIKACLKTTEGVRWTMTPEQRAARPRRKPTVADPGGLF